MICVLRRECDVKNLRNDGSNVSALCVCVCLDESGLCVCCWVGCERVW